LASGTLDKWKWNGHEASEAIYADVAQQIHALLNGQQMIDRNGVQRDIRPGDIAVLLSSHKNADRVHDILSLAGIPAVRYRTQSVFESRGSLDWRILLEALCQPTNSGLVRALMVSAFGDLKIEKMAALNSESASVKVGEWQRQCASWADRLQRTGIAGLYHHVRAHRGLEAAVVARPGGERLLTDLDHIAEVLASRPGLGRGATAADYRRELASLCRDTTRVNEYERRIESDDAAVHVATVHFSKGLEFPIVFLPSMFTRGNAQIPFVYNIDGQRFVDVAHKVKWVDTSTPGSADLREVLSAQADLGDEMRKFYVAATRAEQKLIIYWSPNSGSMKSALGRVLFGRDDEGRIVNDPVTHTPIANETRSNKEMLRMLETVAQSDPSIDLISLDPETEPLVGDRQLVVPPGAVSVAVLDRQEPLRRPDWRKWSYSALVKGKHHAKSSSPNDGAVGHDEDLVGDDQDHSPDANGRSDVLKMTAPILFPDGLRGTGFGSLIHSLFEHLDPSLENFTESLGRELRQRSRTLTPQAVTALITAITHVVRTPLGSGFADRDLSLIPGKDRLAEVKFDFRLPQDDSISMSEIGSLMERHLANGDPFLDYARSWSGNAGAQRLAGYLYGEIDAVFRIDTGVNSGLENKTKYFVCDYKTNRLHVVGSADALEAYSPQNMAIEMANSNYVLQALLYSVALHRYLGLRLPNYDPDHHLGGIAYLFVRGMIGPDSYRPQDNSAHGVFTWTPPVALITELDARFATGGG
jgi:exodeoxyribonuclease V beta subunit